MDKATNIIVKNNRNEKSQTQFGQTVGIIYASDEVYTFVCCLCHYLNTFHEVDGLKAHLKSVHIVNNSNAVDLAQSRNESQNSSLCSAEENDVSNKQISSARILCETDNLQHAEILIPRNTTLKNTKEPKVSSKVSTINKKKNKKKKAKSCKIVKINGKKNLKSAKEMVDHKSSSAKSLTKGAVKLVELMNFRCTICTDILDSKKSLRDHLLRHSGDKPYKCECCSRDFYKHSSLKEHQKTHTKEKQFETNFQCKFCARVFLNSNNLKYHLANHLGMADMCEHCNRPKSSNMSNHNASPKAESKKCNCTQINGEVVPKINYKEENSTKVENIMVLKSSSCSTLSTRLEALNDRLKCNDCQKTFENTAELELHSKKHQKDKSVETEPVIINSENGNSLTNKDKPACRIILKNRNTLAIVPKTSIVRQKCMQCQETFKNTAELELHLKVHQMDKSVETVPVIISSENGNSITSKESPACRIILKSRNTLGIVSKTPAVRQKCMLCQETFENSAELELHLKVHQMDKSTETVKSNKSETESFAYQNNTQCITSLSSRKEESKATSSLDASVNQSRNEILTNSPTYQEEKQHNKALRSRTALQTRSKTLTMNNNEDNGEQNLNYLKSENELHTDSIAHIVTEQHHKNEEIIESKTEHNLKINQNNMSAANLTDTSQSKTSFVNRTHGNPKITTYGTALRSRNATTCSKDHVVSMQLNECLKSFKSNQNNKNAVTVTDNTSNKKGSMFLDCSQANSKKSEKDINLKSGNELHTDCRNKVEEIAKGKAEHNVKLNQSKLKLSNIPGIGNIKNGSSILTRLQRNQQKPKNIMRLKTRNAFAAQSQAHLHCQKSIQSQNTLEGTAEVELHLKAHQTKMIDDTGTSSEIGNALRNCSPATQNKWMHTKTLRSKKGLPTQTAAHLKSEINECQESSTNNSKHFSKTQQRNTSAVVATNVKSSKVAASVEFHEVEPKCFHCQQTFEKPSELEVHLKMHHNSTTAVTMPAECSVSEVKVEDCLTNKVKEEFIDTHLENTHIRLPQFISSAASKDLPLKRKCVANETFEVNKKHNPLVMTIIGHWPEYEKFATSTSNHSQQENQNYLPLQTSKSITKQKCCSHCQTDLNDNTHHTCSNSEASSKDYTRCQTNSNILTEIASKSLAVQNSLLIDIKEEFVDECDYDMR